MIRQVAKNPDAWKNLSEESPKVINKNSLLFLEKHRVHINATVISIADLNTGGAHTEEAGGAFQTQCSDSQSAGSCDSSMEIHRRVGGVTVSLHSIDQTKRQRTKTT